MSQADILLDAPAIPRVEAAPTRRARVGRAAYDLVSRYPVTTLLAGACLLVGLVTELTGTGVGSLVDRGDAMAYGLPALQEGHWWTFVSGSFFAPQLILYVPILAMLVLVASTFERRVGHWQTLVTVLGGQVAAAVLTALFLWPFQGSGWIWATSLGGSVDVGISAGGFATLAALTAIMQPVWRRRVRVGVSAYLIGMLLQVGLLWDAEHLVAWTIGLALGPLLAARGPARSAPVRPGLRTQRALVALVIALNAVTTLLEAMWPGNGGPFLASRGGHTEHGVSLGLVIGSLLVLAFADALRRGRRFAWIVTTGLMAVAFVGLVGADSGPQRTTGFVVVGSMLAMLILTRRAFGVRTDRRSFRRAGRRLAWVAVALLGYTAVGFVVLKDELPSGTGPLDVLAELASRLLLADGTLAPTTGAANVFVSSIGAVWIAAVLITLVQLVYSSRRDETEPDAGERLRPLLREHGSGSIQWMLTWDGNDLWFDSTGTTVIGYRVVGSVALCLADPVGPIENRLAALREFDEMCFERGWIPCLFAADAETAVLAPAVHWKAVQVAEDSIVSLPELEFRGKAWQDVRTAMNKAAKQDIRFEITRWADAAPAVTDQLRAISNGWVSDKPLPEMGFTLGTLTEADDPEVRLGLAVDGDGTIHGFVSWMPVSHGGEVIGWTIDLMRRRDGGFGPVMEYLIAMSALAFKEQGYHFISLSAAPLAKAPEHLDASSDEHVLQRLLDFLGDTLEPYYGFRSLLAFKGKFQPEFRPMYLVFPDETALAEIGIAIVRAYLPDAGLRDYVSMARTMHG